MLEGAAKAEEIVKAARVAAVYEYFMLNEYDQTIAQKSEWRKSG